MIDRLQRVKTQINSYSKVRKLKINLKKDNSNQKHSSHVRKFPSGNDFTFPLESPSVQYGHTAVSHCTRWQQRGAKRMVESVQHCTGVSLVEQQRLRGPVQKQTDPLGPLHNLQGHFLPRVKEGVVDLIVR